MAEASAALAAGYIQHLMEYMRLVAAAVQVERPLLALSTIVLKMAIIFQGAVHPLENLMGLLDLTLLRSGALVADADGALLPVLGRDWQRQSRAWVEVALGASATKTTTGVDKTVVCLAAAADEAVTVDSAAAAAALSTTPPLREAFIFGAKVDRALFSLNTSR